MIYNTLQRTTKDQVTRTPHSIAFLSSLVISTNPRVEIHHTYICRYTNCISSRACDLPVFKMTTSGSGIGSLIKT